MSDQHDTIHRRIQERINQRAALTAHTVAYVICVLLALIAGTTLGLGSLPLVITLALWWGTGLAVHGVIALRGKIAQADALDNAVIAELSQLYGADWRTQIDQTDYDQVYQRIAERFDRRTAFEAHAAGYAVFNLWVWIIWMGFAPDQTPLLPLLFSVLWGLGLAIHGAITYFTGRESLYQRELHRELERERRRADLLPKAKRTEAAMRLSDDGELVEIEDLEKPKRAQR